MGLTPTAFWEMTPREFQAFAKVKEAHEELQAMRWAVACAMFANAHFRGDLHPQAFTPDDFLGRSAPQDEHRGLTAAQQAVFEREKNRLNLALTGALSDEMVPEWAKATVAASKARNQVH